MDPTLPPGDAPPEDIVMAPPEEEAVAQVAQVEAEATGEVAQAMPEQQHAVEQQHLMEVQQEQQQLQPEVAQAEEGALAAAGAAAAAQPAVMHAMTPDGQTVPITFDPQTGQYVTASGEVVVLQMPGGAEMPGAAAADPGGGQGDAVQQQQDPKDGQVQQAMEQEPTSVLPDLGEQQQTTEGGGEITTEPEQPDPAESTEDPSLSIQQPQQIKPAHAELVSQPPQQPPPQQPPQQQIRLVNSDGTVSTLGNVRPSPVQQQSQQQQQIRIVKLEPGVQQQQPQLQQPQQQQIRIVNSDGSISVLNAGNVRVVGSQSGAGGATRQIRVVRTGGGADVVAPKSPTRTTLTLAQAQQMGLLASPPAGGGGGSGPTKVRLSPVKMEGGGYRQVVIRQQQGTQGTAVATAAAGTGQQQVIRIPSGGLQAGTLQQIQVGNKVQYVRVVSSSGGSSSSKASPTGGAITLSALKGLKIAIPPSKTTSGRPQQRVILPHGGIKAIPVTAEKTQDSASAVQVKKERPAPAKASSSSERPSPPSSSSAGGGAAPGPAAPFEATGVRPRKPCNCTKSQCLKLYCDCFANGEFCHNCNCNNCFNNLEHEEERQKAIKQCLDRNSNAFKPKIGRTAADGERRHNKGCNCKRSGCLKNYCECYEAKIPCTDACRCLGCKNVEEDAERRKDMFLGAGINGGAPSSAGIQLGVGGGRVSVASANAAVAPSMAQQQQHLDHLQQQLSSALPGMHPFAAESQSSTRAMPSLRSRLGPIADASSPGLSSRSQQQQPFSFITPEVVEATCQCLLAQAEESERNGLGEGEAEGLILEEFGRCLNQIIGFSKSQRPHPLSAQQL